jgi:nucleoside-diphosphate-sugar epimerase
MRRQEAPVFLAEPLLCAIMMVSHGRGVEVMAVIITGGYGLLGSWLAHGFACDGEEVLVLDVRQRELDYLEEHRGLIQFAQADVLDFPRLSEIFSKQRGRIDGVIHTVAAMAAPSFWANPHHSLRLNVMGTVNVLEVVRQFDVGRFLFVSSGAIYGELEVSAHELRNPMHPSDLYGASKASGEFIALQYARHYGIDVRCARPFFFFGPGKLPSEMPHLFTNLLGPLEGLRGLRLEKGRDQRLGFTYVKDTARGTYLLYRAENPAHRTMNIAAEKPVSFSEMVRLARACSHTPTDVDLGPGKLFPRGETLDISLAREELGFSPLYSVEQGIREYGEWVRRNGAGGGGAGGRG